MFKVLITFLTLVSQAEALVIRDDPGGLVAVYQQLFERLARSGERVVVDGRCASACTLVLFYIPRERLCATSRARFGFHAAYNIGNGRTERGTTAWMLSSYPEHVRRYIAGHGGLTRKMVYMKGTAAAPACG